MYKPRPLCWEDSAKRVTPSEGWACVRCGRWYGDGPFGERAARYCCSTDAPCECGQRRSKHYTVCDTCRGKREIERWLAMPEVDLDGESPLCVHGTDRYFFSVDDLCDYLDEYELVFAEGEEEVTPTTEEFRKEALNEVRLCFCVPVLPPHFDLLEFIYDHDEEAELDADGQQVENAVNDWLKKSCQMWTEGKSRPTRESVLKAICPDSRAAEAAKEVAK